MSTVCVACTVCPHSYSQLSNAIPAEQPLSAQCWERMSGMEGNGKYLGGDSYTRQESPTTIYQIVNGTDVPGTNPWPTCLRGEDVFGSQPCLVILSLSILVAGLLFLLICVTIVQEGKVSLDNTTSTITNKQKNTHMLNNNMQIKHKLVPSNRRV